MKTNHLTKYSFIEKNRSANIEKVLGLRKGIYKDNNDQLET